MTRSVGRPRGARSPRTRRRCGCASGHRSSWPHPRPPAGPSLARPPVPRSAAVRRGRPAIPRGCRRTGSPAPAQSVTMPPASWIRTVPAATSQEPSDSRRTHRTPAATHARSSAAAPGRRRSSNSSNAAQGSSSAGAVPSGGTGSPSRRRPARAGGRPRDLLPGPSLLGRDAPPPRRPPGRAEERSTRRRPRAAPLPRAPPRPRRRGSRGGSSSCRPADPPASTARRVSPPRSSPSSGMSGRGAVRISAIARSLARSTAVT